MDEDLFGFSPCLQMIQKENAAILLYYIPKIDPFKDYRPKGGSASDRSKELIQECFIYLPKTVDERIQTEKGFFIRDENIYISIIPFSSEAEWKESVRKDFIRISVPGELAGFAIEIGDKEEFGSFDEFRARFNPKNLDLSRIQSRVVEYLTSRGHKLFIQHTGFDSGLPDGAINAEKIEWPSYPALDSPYVKVEDHVLDVNDGKNGFTIDWSGKYPAYVYYRIEHGKKDVIRKVWVHEGEIKEWPPQDE